MAPSNPLSPAAILRGMAEALPTHPKGDTTSDLSSSYEAVALLAHAVMVSLEFRLVGFDEDDASTNEARCRELAPRLPPSWNASFGTCSFAYAHPQSAMRFVVRVDRLGPRAEIRGLAVGHDRIARTELVIRDFVSANALPLRITLVGGSGSGGRRQGVGDPRGDDHDHDHDNTRDPNATSSDEPEEDRSDLPDKLRDVMINDARVADLTSLIKVQIVQRLLPSMQKEGYEEESPDDRAAREYAEDVARRGEGGRQPRPQPQPNIEPRPARPYPFDDPLDPQPRNPQPPGADFPPPGFEDPYDINRPPGRGGPLGVGGPGRTPFGNIGADDLNPPALGPHDPLHPGGAGGLGVGGLPRPGGGRGMHPTFDDPLFGGPGGVGGGDFGADDDLRIPPGARYDPIGPGGLPRLSGRGRGGGGGAGGFGGFGGFGGGGGGII